MKKVYLILGASSDLGIELIKQLNGENPTDEKVFIAHYHSSKEKLEQISLNQNRSLVCVKSDLGDMASVDLLIEKVRSCCAEYNMDAPTHVVHLAAEPFRYMKLKEFSRDRLIHNIDVQVSSFAKIMQSFLPSMAKRKRHDKVVVMLTSYLLNASPKLVLDYVVTKSALLGLMRSIAADYLGKGVNINALSPSMIETKFLQNVDERIVQMIAEGSPEKRNATVADVVPVIQFLLSDAANYLHGANLNVTYGGGFR
ncbi:MAG: SDR family oxidoreductase [Clostridiales bacterium]|nr:SDR family oxidoreductase [Clostridiales bacterium]